MDFFSYMYRVTIYSQNLTNILDIHLFITDKELVYIFFKYGIENKYYFISIIMQQLKEFVK